MTSFNDTLKKNAKDYECTLNSTKEVRTSKNLDEYEYMNLLRNTFDRSLFSNDFDEWTVNQKCTWINKNLSKFYPNVAVSLLEFIPASFCQEDCDRSPVEKAK